MKKNCITFFCCCIILLVSILSGCVNKEDYLRIHIRANSNSKQDQAVKYLVRDEVVNFLSPLVCNCNSKQEALQVVINNQTAVNGLIDGFLREKGFNYGCSISIKKENFPTRVYQNITLEQGVYDAVIIELGSGKGENWWCVIYPSFCFLSNEKVNYRSKIWDIINGL